MTRSSSIGSRAPGTLGPIADLESHLPSEWWRELFDSVYLKTDGDVVENEMNTRREIELLLATTGMTPGDRIVDLCCGQGRHALELARRGYGGVIGIDRSRYLIRLARRRAKKESLDAVFREGDARTFRLPERSIHYIVMMGNSFGYFDSEEDDHRVLSRIGATLAEGGMLVMDLTDGDWIRENYSKRSWEWIDQNHFVCRERTLTADEQRLVTREVVTHAERGVIADQFYAERLYSAERIQQLLEGQMYRNVQVAGELNAHSTRDQDLGMMAQRMFVTADAPRSISSGTAKPRSKLKVAVALGDPRLPDQVKLDGQFGDADHETVKLLKSALDKIPGYSFEYFDNHSTFMRDFENWSGDFVLNLCDEGFENDAFKELHVPAYFEMLGLRYSGAGPSCLATCYDKSLVRSLATAHDIPVPMETYIALPDQTATLPSIFPALLKPSQGDSSIGINQKAVVNDASELITQLQYLRETLPGRPLLIQEFLSGAEFSVALIGNPEHELSALPILRVDYQGLDPDLPKLLGYESKWDPESPYWRDIKYVPAKLSANEERKLVAYSKRLFALLGCRDYARFDYRADMDGVIKLLEVNPNPGWCWDGKLNLMAAFDGLEYHQFLQNVLDVASIRLLSTQPMPRLDAKAA